jgi:hypothetical protein
MAASSSKRQGSAKQNGIEIPKIFRRARFAPGLGGSVADTPHIFCRLDTAADRHHKIAVSRT